MNALYPIFLKLACKPVLVVGGGAVAEQKIQGLLAAGARITVIAPEVSGNIRQFTEGGQLTLKQRRYAEGDVEGYVLAIGATDDPVVQDAVYQDATQRTIPVNIVDVPDRCTFYLGSIFQQGDLKIAVSTNGKSPTLGKIIRDKIRNQYTKGYPDLLERLGEMRSTVFAEFTEYEQRKQVFAQIVEEEVRRIEQHKKETNGKVSSPEGIPLSTPSSYFAGHSSLSKGEKCSSLHTSITTGKGRERLGGKVYLVGAGPGDPELITVKALRVLQSADVIVYDALINEELLSSAKDSAEMIYAGKRSSHHSMKQEEINDLLIAKARSGKSVVRLKGGDPFVFGRGGEELEALQDAGIEVEVIPGITAGVGVLGSVGIPLTHRQIASSVAFVTGHECGIKDKPIDWNALAVIDTLVIYMGVRTIGSIAQRLRDAGRSPDTPAAVIFSGTLPEEIIIEGTLETIAGKVKDHPTDAPGLIVVGEVVRFLEGQRKRSPEERMFMSTVGSRHASTQPKDCYL